MADRILVLSHRPGTVISSIDVNLSIEDRTPFKARSAPEFRDYFNLIWKELGQHEKY